MKCEVPFKKLSNSWSTMTNLKLTVSLQLLGENKLWSNHCRNIAKGLLKCPAILAYFRN